MSNINANRKPLSAILAGNNCARPAPVQETRAIRSSLCASAGRGDRGDDIHVGNHPEQLFFRIDHGDGADPVIHEVV